VNRRIPNISGPQWVLAFSLSVLLGVTACAGKKRFERVEEFPTGPQINYAASSFFAGVRTSLLSDRYTAPYEVVWAEAKRVMEQLERIGVNPKLSLDEDYGLILLTMDHRDEEAKTMFNPDSLRIRGWRDEFRVEVIKISEDRTKVMVSRTVLGMPYEKRCPDRAEKCPKPILYQPEVSNEKIESWILTKIQDGVAKPY
jgi:hypothetical protein